MHAAGSAPLVMRNARLQRIAQRKFIARVVLAAGLVLAIVATSRGWLDGLDLVLASDDDGPCGAAVLRRQWRGH